MFAFAVWDKQESRLFVARDRFGIKPLYYHEGKNFIAFSSEIKALIPLMSKLQPNDALIYDFLAHGRVDHLDDTFFSGIKRFPASHYGIVSDKGIEIDQWYDIEEEMLKIRGNPEFESKSTSGHIRSVSNLLFDAVRLRLRSDVPVGSCLSGGLDSSSIASIAVSLMPPEDKSKFETYSAVYGPWFDHDERIYIESIVSKIDVKANFTIPTISCFLKQFHEFLYHQEEPVTNVSAFCQFCVMALAKSRGAKVLLDGQGGDEILGGHDYMLGYFMAEKFRKREFTNLLRLVIVAFQRRYLYPLSVFVYQLLPQSLQRRFSLRFGLHLNRDFMKRFEKRHIVENLLYLGGDLNSALVNHVRFKLQHLLRWEDKSSMAFSIETRVPFLDHNLVSYVLALSSDFKIRSNFTKWVLRAAMASILPEVILNRTDKIGFAAPEREWMNQNNLKFYEDLVTDPHPLLAKYLDLGQLKRFIQKDIGGLDFEICRHLFRVICLDKWLKIFFNSELPISASGHAEEATS
jgi:asparagine synthase (glutamine-hydrolysing)